jgi:hypothetical protein
MYNHVHATANAQKDPHRLCGEKRNVQEPSGTTPKRTCALLNALTSWLDGKNPHDPHHRCDSGHFLGRC